MTAQYIHNMEFHYLNSSSLNPVVWCIVEFAVCWHLNSMKTEHISMWEVFSKFWHLDITNLDPIFSVSMGNPKWTEHNIKYIIFKLLYNLKDKQARFKKNTHTWNFISIRAAMLSPFWQDRSLGKKVGVNDLHECKHAQTCPCQMWHLFVTFWMFRAYFCIQLNNIGLFFPFRWILH